MKRRLFLTGEMGVGKSTAISQALNKNYAGLGGFLTQRKRDTNGRIVSFSLQSLHGEEERIFLDFSTGKPEIHMDVFETFGVSSLEGNALVLDEIGGIELLNPVFLEKLEAVLRSEVPIIGVLKGPGPASSLMKALGLSEEYQRCANALYQMLSQDENTMIYTCDQYDQYALELTREWAGEFIHG